MNMFESESVEVLRSKDKHAISQSNVPRGKGLAWMVLFGSCLSQFLIGGLASSLGIFYVEMQEDLNVSIVELSVIGSIRNGVMNSIVVLTSPVTENIGCRRMAIIGALLSSFSRLICSFWGSIYVFYMFLGIISGFGNAMTMTSSIIIINKYFKEKKTFAMAMITTAGSLGTVMFGPFTSYLLDTYGIYGSLLITAGINFNMLVGGMIFLPVPCLQNKDVSGNNSMIKDLVKALSVYKTTLLWKNPRFYFILISCVLNGFSAYIPTQLLPNYMVSHNSTLEEGALSITAYGIASTITRFLAGVIANIFPVVTLVLYTAGGIIAGLFLCLIPGFETAPQFILAATGYGVGYGCVIALTNAVLISIFGDENLSTCLGVSLMAKGIGSVMGSPTVSAVAEVVPITGIEYILAGTVIILSGLIMLPMLFRRKYSSDERTSLLQHGNENFNEKSNGQTYS